MATKPKEPKVDMVCANCNEIFTGKKCPECGNTKGNLELSHDGIPKQEHMMNGAFGNASGLQPESEALSDNFLMSQELATQQRIEMQDNLRESFLIKSKMKKIELEAKLRDKEAEYEPSHVPRAPMPEPQQPPMQAMPQFPQNTMNPQAQFMNQFMKMDMEDRTEFLNQLADADPNALSTLSGFFSQQQPMMQPQAPPNPYMQQSMPPYMQYPPPWAQQQQYEPQPPAKDPTEAAIDMIEKLQNMSDRNKRNEPSESTTIISALREELQAVNERIGAMATDSQNSQNEALMQRLGQIENKVFTPQQGNSIKEQIHSIKAMVDDLQDIGFMAKPETTNTVEEQIKLNEAKHQIKLDERELDIKEATAKAARADKDMKSALVSGLFRRQLHKTLGQDEQMTQPPIGSPLLVTQPPNSPPPYVPSAAPVVVEEFASDAGTVRETRTVSDSE